MRVDLQVRSRTGRCSGHNRLVRASLTETSAQRVLAGSMPMQLNRNESPAVEAVVVEAHAQSRTWFWNLFDGHSHLK